MSEGSGVIYEKTYTGIIDEKFKDIEFSNASAASYAGSIYLSKIKYLINQNYKFDHLLIHLDISDVWDDYFRYDYENGIAHDLGKNKNVRDYYLNMLTVNLPNTHRVFSYLRNLSLAKIKTNDILNMEAGQFVYDNNLGFNNLNERDLAFNKTFNFLSEIHNILKQKNIKFSILIVPWPSTLANAKENNYFTDKIEKFCENRCDNFVNTFQIFFNINKDKGLDYTIKKYFFVNEKDHHLNEEGHSIVAQALIDKIKNSNSW